MIEYKQKHKTKLLCFRLTTKQKSDITTMARLKGITPSDIFQRYAAALIAKETEVLPPREGY